MSNAIPKIVMTLFVNLHYKSTVKQVR